MWARVCYMRVCCECAVRCVYACIGWVYAFVVNARVCMRMCWVYAFVVNARANRCMQKHID